MDMTEFDQALDGAEMDPRARWKAAAKAICESRLAGIPSDIAEDIKVSLLHELGKNLRQCLEEARIIDGNRLLVAFDVKLGNAIMREHQLGRLKPVTASSEVARRIDDFRQHAWNSFEVDGVIRLAPDGQRITTIDFGAISFADGRTVTRRDLREKLRPPSIFDSKWEALFTSPREIDAAREEKSLREAPQRLYAGTGPLDENGRPLQDRKAFE